MFGGIQYCVFLCSYRWYESKLFTFLFNSSNLYFYFSELIQIQFFWLSVFVSFLAPLYSSKQKDLFSGELCGLLPGKEPTSEQLHRVVELSSGIIDDQELLTTGGASPVAKLKEALTSKKAFQKYYLVRRSVPIFEEPVLYIWSPVPIVWIR